MCQQHSIIHAKAVHALVLQMSRSTQLQTLQTDVTATYLIQNVQLWSVARSTADWVVLDSLEQVVSVPPECLWP